MSAEELLLRGRIDAEDLMVDTCIVDVEVDKHLNQTTGRMEPVYSDALYDGKCRIQDPGTQGTQPTAGEHQFTLYDHITQLPMVSSDYITDPDTGRQVVIPIGARVRISAVDPSSNPDLLSSEFTVVGHGKKKTHATRRDLLCIEVLA